MKRVTDSALVKNSLALISGTVFTQAIVFMFSPWLARIFGLADFGNLANYNAWVAILALLSSLRYEHAVIVANGKDETNRVIALTGVMSVTSCCLYAVIAAVMRLDFDAGGYVNEIRPIIWFIPIGVLFVCLSSLLTQFNYKVGGFRRLARVTVAQVLCTVIPQIALGLLHVPHALIIGTITGTMFAAAALGWMFMTSNGLHPLRGHFGWAELRATARRHANFPRYTLPADAIAVVVQQFVPVFVLALYNPAIAGLYSFSLRVVRVPLLVVSTAIAGALRKEAADRVHAGRSLRPVFTGTLKTLLALAVGPFVVLALFAPEIFGVVFGSQWVDAGRVVQILSPGILLEFVAIPMATFFLVTNTQRFTFGIQLTGFALLVAALWTGKHFLGGFIATSFLISGAMIVVNLASVLLAARVSVSTAGNS